MHSPLGGRGLRNLPSPQHHIRARDLARQNRRVVAGADLDVFARKQHGQVLLQRRNRLLNDEVVLGPTGRTPHDQADRARGLPVDQDLPGLHDRGVGDRRIRDCDPRDVEVRRQDRRSTRCQRDFLIFHRACGRLRRRRRSGHRRLRRHRRRRLERGLARERRRRRPRTERHTPASRAYRRRTLQWTSLLYDLFAALGSADSLDLVHWFGSLECYFEPACCGTTRGWPFFTFTTGGSSGAPIRLASRTPFVSVGTISSGFRSTSMIAPEF